MVANYLDTSDMYISLADRKRSGHMNVKDSKEHNPRFLILYFDSTESDNMYRVFRVRNGSRKDRKWMVSNRYPIAEEDANVIQYYCYYLDEEVSLGQLNVGRFLTLHRILAGGNDIEGETFFATTEEVLKWRSSPPGLLS